MILRRSVLGVVVGTVGLVLCAVWTSVSYKQATGADSPSRAVEYFLAAAERGDVVGVAAVLLAEEGRLFAPGAEQSVRQLRRFGSLSESPLTPKVSSSARNWRLESVSPAFARGEGERATVRVLFPEYPKGTQNFDRVTQTLNDTRAGRWARHFLSASGNDRDRSILLVTVCSKGRWYVSITSTVGQGWDRLAARKHRSSKNVTPPSLTESRRPDETSIGADSAEQAVQDWLDALADLDYQRLRARTNPLEAAAFPIDAIIAVWGGRVEKLRRQFELTVPDSTAPVKSLNNRFGTQVVVPVTVRDAKFALTEPGAEPFVAQYHEGCLVVLSGGKATKHCGREIPRFGEQFSIPVSKATIDRFVGRVESLASARRSLPGFVVVRRDEKWFVSPTQTLLLGLGEALSNAKRADIEALVDDVSNAISSDR